MAQIQEFTPKSNWHSRYKEYPVFINYRLDYVLIPLFGLNKKETGYAVINIEYANIILKYTWTISRDDSGRISYLVNSDNISMHQMVMSKKAPSGYKIDHINRNPLDNRRGNLWFATNRQNAQNRRKKENTSSKYIGVCLRSSGTWECGIRNNGYKIYLGRFQNEEIAAKMYDVHAILYYGINAQTNNMLTVQEKQWIIDNKMPLSRFEKPMKNRSLPKNITKAGNKYRLRINRNYEKLDILSASLDELLGIKEEFISRHENNAKNEEIERLNNPTVNNEGIYYISVYANGGTSEVFVDSHVWSDVSKHNWNLTAKGYYQAELGNRRLRLHNYIWSRYVGVIPSRLTVDHIKSENKHDNRLQNLRLADSSLQNHNKRKYKNCVEKYRGVIFRNGKYHTFIKGNRYGSFETEEEAALKANEVYKQTYGKNANLNKIDFSIKTTKENRIPEELITPEYVRNIKTCKDLKHIVTLKKLNKKEGGPIKISDIKGKNLEAIKGIIITCLFNL